MNISLLNKVLKSLVVCHLLQSNAFSFFGKQLNAFPSFNDLSIDAVGESVDVSIQIFNV